jgi:hypothetical protein
MSGSYARSVYLIAVLVAGWAFDVVQHRASYKIRFTTLKIYSLLQFVCLFSLCVLWQRMVTKSRHFES